jgi:hypothetical protein
MLHRPNWVLSHGHAERLHFESILKLKRSSRMPIFSLPKGLKHLLLNCVNIYSSRFKEGKLKKKRHSNYNCLTDCEPWLCGSKLSSSRETPFIRCKPCMANISPLRCGIIYPSGLKAKPGRCTKFLRLL